MSNVIIQNPPLFMTAKYLSQKILKDNFEDGMADVIEKYGCPEKVLIAFDDAEIANDFIETYNNQSVEETID